MLDKKSTILVVDDEDQIRKMLSIFLSTSDYNIEESKSGQQALRMSTSVKPDLIVLDLGLPDMDGKELIGQIRQWSQVPIIVLSARSMDEEVVAALDKGADDYVIKPFSADVLMARIKTNLRKAVVQEAGEPTLVNGPLRMDLVRHEVYLHDKKIAFTPKEYELLRYLMINRGKMLTHRQILNEIWGPAHGTNMQYLRVYIGNVREKLADNSGDPELIVTVPSVGYRMEILPSSVAA